MINAIRSRIIYADPGDGIARYAIEKRKAEQKEFEEKIKSRGLIPSTSGPPANIFGQHLPTMADPADEPKSTKLKKQKGVWYVPWYEDKDTISPASIDTIALATLSAALQDLTKPELKWDINTPKGLKSRANFAEYMQRVAVAMWRAKKINENDDLLPSRAISAGVSGREKISGRGLARGAGGRGGEGVGGPPNSANLLGRGRAGRSGRGAR
jgi:hypothetical protein